MKDVLPVPGGPLSTKLLLSNISITAECWEESADSINEGKVVLISSSSTLYISSEDGIELPERSFSSKSFGFSDIFWISGSSLSSDA